MNGSIHEIEAQRARWREYRVRQALTLEAVDNFARGGLGTRADELDVRLSVLPADPEGDAVPLDREALAWLKEERQSPFGNNYPNWGHRDRGMNDALVMYDQYKEAGGWTRYLALGRHGGIEFGARLASETDRGRIFWLRQIVGAAWLALALQEEAISKWEVAGPYEVVVAFQNTKGAKLGGFAEGWREPTYGYDEHTMCLDEHLLLRREVKEIDAKSIALDLGDRTELAFGTTLKRHIANRGDYEDRFDPRFQVF